MISDKYILSVQNADKLLDITEHMASCYGFSGKELFKIRLITEEMFTSVQSGITLAPGEMWFSARNGMFIATVSVLADSRGISQGQREKLLGVVSSKKSHVFGFIQKFFDEMAVTDGVTSFTEYVQAYGGDVAGSCADNPAGNATGNVTGNSWALDALESLVPAQSPEGKADVIAAGDLAEKDLAEKDLEIRLIKGFADDIRVIDRQETLEMSVFKKIPDEFIKDFIFQNR